MAEIEAAATRLKDLASLASRRAQERGLPSEVPQVPSPVAQKSPVQLEYERLVGKLSAEERETLDRLIEAMWQP